MFRVSQFMRELRYPTPVGPRRDPPGPPALAGSETSPEEVASIRSDNV